MLQTDTGSQNAVLESRIMRRIPFFYGWVVLMAATVGMIMTSPGQTYSISIFIEYFIQDLGISRSMVSTYYTIGTLGGSLALPFIGRQIDLRGPRVMVVVIAALFGLACIYMGIVQSGLMLLFGFVGVRMMGQGSLGLVSNYVINQWWVRRRGAILGLSGVLMAMLGLAGFPNLINWLIPLIGWRMTFMTLGFALIGIMVPIGWAFYRERPERYGLAPDNVAMKPSAQAQRETNSTKEDWVEENWTVEEARRTSAFWITVFGLGTIGALSTGLTFHMVSIFADNSLSATAAAAVYVPIAATSAIVNLTSGILVDRIPVRLLLAGALFLQALALLLAQVLTGVEMAILYGVVLGVMMGMMRTVSTVIWPTYYGRQYLGSITGLASTMLVAGSALGPMPMGIARDLLGSYNLALTVLAIIPLTLSVVSLFMRRPTRSTPTSAASA